MRDLATRSVIATGLARPYSGQASCRLVRLSAPLEDALKLQRPLPDDALRIVALVEKADE
jgi:hypothetical protein